MSLKYFSKPKNIINIETKDYSISKIILFGLHNIKHDLVRSCFNTLNKDLSINLEDLGDSSLTLNKTLDLLAARKSQKILISSITFDELVCLYQNPVHISKIYNKCTPYNIAYQRQYMSNSSDLFSSISLGELRKDPSSIEVLFRDRDSFHFDMSAIRRSDIEDNISSSPTGLTAEEACQIMRYIGESNHFNIMTFSYDIANPSDYSPTLELLSIMLWYLLEGLSLPKNHPSSDQSFIQFLVESNDIDYTLEFYQSKVTEKWWIKNDQNSFLPISFTDYQSTISGTIPYRLLDFL